MSLKCSVFGHAYGDVEITREREEDGSEVITTIRETQECKRCGEQRVVSENKEVTTLETAADIVADDLEEDSEPSTEAPSSETTAPEADEDAPTPAPAPDDDGATILDAETGTDVATDELDDVDPVEEPSSEDDDGVILEDEEPTPEREPGEWPAEPEDSDDDWRPETDIDPMPEEEERTVEPTGSAVSVPDGEFYCPECEFRTPVRESSHREGDFCPECHRGTLEHVPE